MKKKNTFAELKSNEKRVRQGMIVEAAQRVFAVKPFNNVSIRDIAREAGISHASIYRYFPDQQSLFVEAFLHGAEEITAILDGIIKNSRKNPIEKVAEAYLSYLIDNDQYFRMMTHFMLDGSLSSEMVERLNVSERRLFDKFDTLFRKVNMPEPVRPLSHAFFAALNGVLITFRNYPGRNLKDVHHHMHRIARIIVSKFCATSV
ncbi:MAG TPA: TetR/AcrR family transcriptional regulator [Smithella sp.]|nr:TetR/AcrR family transcriptional regulator [Smithella sp.]